MNTSESTATLAGKLAEVQQSLKNAQLDSENPHFKSRYASLAAIRDATVPALAKHGIAMIQGTTVTDEGKLFAFTRLAFGDEWYESTYPVAFDKPQQMGSALTYAKRYMLAAMCGISAEEDDDANAAQEGSAPKAGKSNGKPSTPKANGNARYDRFKKACEANSISLMEAVKKAEDEFAAKPSELTDTAFESLITWIEGAGELNGILNEEDAA